MLLKIVIFDVSKSKVPTSPAVSISVEKKYDMNEGESKRMSNNQ